MGGLGYFTDRRSCNAGGVFVTEECTSLSPLPPEGVTDNSVKKMERRNDDQSILDARARYLERKQQKAQGLSGPLKEMG